MLVLSRKVGERLLIGDQIVVTVVKAGPGAVRLGIEAPASMPVAREELAQQIAAEVARQEANGVPLPQADTDSD
ncbi:MAG: carbon storage regulator [Planctomycetales bacterium]|nr:carbon storage regulator [Planctomycetales bacterium]